MQRKIPESQTWGARWARAWQYGHNTLRMPTPELAGFAHGYADLCEEMWLSLGIFYAMWDTGEIEPDHLGRYHHRDWFNGIEKRVA